jgi:hypothetical protein
MESVHVSSTRLTTTRYHGPVLANIDVVGSYRVLQSSYVGGVGGKNLKEIVLLSMACRTFTLRI